ncbi:MAG: AAA family ATPase [Bacteroidia bacterium]
MKKLPIGIQYFPEIIQGGYAYVDKTEYCHRLITGGKYYFLSRPRRFGKSLLISTLKEIFLGNRDLFEGLWIHDKIDWAPHPVIHLDFTRISKRAPTLEEGIGLALQEIAVENGITLTEPGNPGRFDELIRMMGNGQKVAILVDEYDKPLVDNLDNLELLNLHRQNLKSLYSVLKGNDEHIAFLLLTGVSKFSQVSIFSDLNNLYDITIEEEFGSMLGYTLQELESNFSAHLEAVQTAIGLSADALITLVREWYNGYSWNGRDLVFNPFSILNFLRKKRFEGYWFATGTPTFLMKLIRNRDLTVFDLENREVSLFAINDFDVPSMDLSALLFQSGYLTIKKLSPVDQTVTLGFPNREVADAFSFQLLREFADKGQDQTDSLIRRMNAHLRSGEAQDFIECFKTLFEDIAYPIHPSKGASISNMERYYHSMFYLVLRLLGHNIQAEVMTNRGRIDTVITTERFIYVVEFKLGDAASAMAQIREMGYHHKYLGQGRQVMLLGIGFDTQTRNVGEYLVEVVG